MHQPDGPPAATTSANIRPAPASTDDTLFGTFTTELTRDETTFTSRGARLRAVITAPQTNSATKRPAALILHDEGPRSADGFVGSEFGVKYPQDVPVYRQLARALASHGFIVMTFDKRTCVDGASTYCAAPRQNIESQREHLTAALTDDARAALVKLEGDPRVDRDNVLLIGHGQGAQLAARIATDTPTIRGVVAIAPSASPLDRVIESQLARTKQTIAARLTDAPDTALSDRLTKDLEALEKDSNAYASAFSALRSSESFDGAIANIPATTWRSLFKLHDGAIAFYKSADRQPMLVLAAELDAVLPPANARTLSELLLTKKNRQDRLEVIPNATHNMIDLGDEHAAGTALHPAVPAQIITFSESIMRP